MVKEQITVGADLSDRISGHLDVAKKRLHIEIKDDVTSTPVPEFRIGIKEIMEKVDPTKWNALYLDMRSSRVVDSMGINWLFAESVRVKELKKKMVIRISSPAIHRVMEFAGLDKLVVLKYRRRKQTR